MAQDGRQWRVVGVDPESGDEVSMLFRASSAAVARVMGERKGIHVAEVIDVEREETESLRQEIDDSIETAAHESTPRVARRGEIICPNTRCGYVGPPTKKPRGSVLVGILLCLFFLLPGIIYFIFMRGYRYTCPRCGLQIRSDV